MSKVFNTQVFNDVVASSASAGTPTDPKFDELLGSADSLAIQLVGDQPAGTTPTVTVYLDHSGDRRNWITKSTIIGSTALTGSPTVAFASDTGSTPFLGYVRFRVLVGGGSASARIQLWVTGRTS